MRVLLIKFGERFATISAERGATGIEYGLLIAFIAAAILAGAATLGPTISDAFQTVIDGL